MPHSLSTAQDCKEVPALVWDMPLVHTAVKAAAGQMVVAGANAAVVKSG